MVHTAFRCRSTGAIRRLAMASGWGLALLHATAMASSVFIVNQPWLFPALKGKSTEAFMLLQSSEGGALIGVRSPAAANVAIIAPGGKNASLDRLPLPPGEAVLLAPGKHRLRLVHIDRTLKLGDRVPLVLTIQGADGASQTIAIDVEVRRRSAADDELREHSHHH